MNTTDEMIRSANEFLTISKNKLTFIPNFVNMAFACELYLKTILKHKTGSYQRGHDLEVLYNNMATHISESDFLSVLARKYTELFIDMSITIAPSEAKRNLELMFQQHKNLFAEWRYIFEGAIDKPYVVNNMLIAFAEALNEYVNAFAAKST